MTDEDKKNLDQPTEGDAVAQDENKSEAKKGGMIKYVIFGVAGLVIVVAITFGVLLMLKEDPQTTDDKTTEEVTEPKKSSSKSKASKTEKEDESEDFETENDEFEDDPDEYTLDEDDQDAIDKIVDNLAFLDYEPSTGEIEIEENKISVDDSLEQVSWIEQEKEAIQKRTTELNALEKDLVKREKDINAKINRIEQAESNRISKLAKLYDGMDPRAVAQLMMNLDDETVVSILPRMKGKNASAVLQLIPSKRAARLSKKMITIAGN